MFGLSEICVLSFSILLIIAIKLINKNPPAVFNVYQRPNGFYWLKVAFMFSILSTRKFFSRFKKQPDPKQLFKELETPQPLSSHPNAIDAVYFNGANKNHDFLVVGTARRKNKLIDGFFYLLIQDSKLGLLESPKLPSTSLYQTEETDDYSAEGIKITPVTPMQTWRISYDGEMKQAGNNGKTLKVKLSAEWYATTPYFNFDSDMDALTMAKCTAHEKFSREYFETLKENHQTHYEQHGDIDGTVEIDDVTYKIHVNAVRDHSFGKKREWRSFHRYALHFFTAANGDRFHVGTICLPISFSRLIIGYVFCAKEQKMYPIESCDLELYQHGEDGNAPLDYAFSFTAGGKFYTAQVNVLYSPHFYISKDSESKVIERLCTFRINGVKGWGAAEWQYNNVSNKTQ